MTDSIMDKICQVQVLHIGHIHCLHHDISSYVIFEPEGLYMG